MEISSEFTTGPRTYNVTSTPTLLLSYNRFRVGWAIKNQGTVTAYWGKNSSVVAAASGDNANGGWRLKEDESVGFSQADGYVGPVYAVTASSTTTFSVMEW